MAETTFENAKVGDRVWSPLFGWGKITDKCGDSIDVKPISGIGLFSFFTNGMYFANGVQQTLFWSEVNITAPERPKRKVVKTVEAWAMIDKTGAMWLSTTPFLLKDIFPVKLVGTYEVEE